MRQESAIHRGSATQCKGQRSYWVTEGHGGEIKEGFLEGVPLKLTAARPGALREGQSNRRAGRACEGNRDRGKESAHLGLDVSCEGQGEKCN